MSQELSTRTHIEELLDDGRLEEIVALTERLGTSGPRYADIQDLVEAAKRRLTLIKRFAIAPKAAAQMPCPSCGKPLPSPRTEAQALTCPACSTLIDLRADSRWQIIKRQGTRIRHPFLSIGQRGMINGVGVEIVARISYSAQIREWDAEDKCYESGFWRWTEWVLYSLTGEYWYLSEDSEGYVLFKPQTPQWRTPPTPEQTSVQLMPGVQQRVDELGSATITSIDGQLSWVPANDEKVKYLDVETGGYTYSVEWRYANNQIQELELSRGEGVSIVEIYQMFNLRDLLEAAEAQLAVSREYKFWGGMFVLAVIFLFFVATVRGSAPGKVIFSTASIPGSTLTSTGIIEGPISLSKKNEFYEIEVRGQIPDNSQFWVGVELLDSAKLPLADFEGEIWRESGYDEGHWSESSLREAETFKLETPGTYFLRIGRDESVPLPVGATAQVAVREGVKATWYEWAGGIIAGLFALLLIAIGVQKSRITPPSTGY